jgi:hypothetical protein
LALTVGALAGPASAGEFLAKTYEFRPNIRLEVGLDLGLGLRLESIEFEIPEDPGKSFQVDPRAKVVITNLGEQARRIGIAIALEDEAGRLVGAGTGGTKLFPLRAERQMAYGVSFGDVQSKIGTARAFRIALEVE